MKPPLSHEMSTVSIGDFDKIHEGDKVIAIGHPFGLKYTVTQGIISSLLHEEEDVKYIQHDAALNPGNSGGSISRFKRYGDCILLLCNSKWE